MVDIAPFRAVLYDPRRVGNLTLAVSQPYDKITREEYRGLRDQPYNIVHVELGEEGRTYPDAAYEEAGRVYRAWRSEGVLVREAAPALYRYRQAFVLDGRRLARESMLALLTLPTGETKDIWPHERTLDGPRVDRFRLLKAVRASPGPIFLLYRDEGRALARALARATKGVPPLRRAEMPNGEAHELWAVRDTGAIDLARRTLAGKPVLIADGHHRLRAACEYRDLTGYALRMAAFVEVSDPGLVILPTHRMVRLDGATDPTGWAREFEGAPVDGSAEAVEAEVGRAASAGGGPVFAAGPPDGPFSLYRPPAEGAAPVTPAEVLRERVFPCLGIDPARTENRVLYARTAREATDRARKEGCGLVFILPPVSVETVWAVAGAGRILPPKTTDFYPKMISGLAIQEVD